MPVNDMRPLRSQKHEQERSAAALMSRYLSTSVLRRLFSPERPRSVTAASRLRTAVFVGTPVGCARVEPLRGGRADPSSSSGDGCARSPRDPIAGWRNEEQCPAYPAVLLGDESDFGANFRATAHSADAQIVAVDHAALSSAKGLHRSGE
jgi:hypothetical protein